MQKFKLPLITFAFLFAVILALVTANALQPANIHARDFVSDYLMGRAVRDGANPYTPLPNLATQYLQATLSGYQHPAPHAPLLAILCAPLSLLDLHSASILWLAFQAIAMFLSVGWLHRATGSELSPPLFAALFLLIFNGPLLIVFWQGQLDLFLLVILCLGWKSLREGAEVRAGIWLGLLCALKLIYWPIGLLFIIRGRWRALASMTLTVTAANLVAAVVLGFGVVRDYYLKIGPSVALIYRDRDVNLSAYALGARPFVGVHTSTSTGLQAPALIPSESLAGLFGILAMLILLLIGSWIAWRSAYPDVAFGMMVCVSVVLGPTAWQSYLLLLAIPVGITAAQLRGLKWPRWDLVIIAIAGVLAFAPTWVFWDIARSIGALPVVITHFLTILPLAGVFTLAWLLWRTEKLLCQTKITSIPITSSSPY